MNPDITARLLRRLEAEAKQGAGSIPAAGETGGRRPLVITEIGAKAITLLLGWRPISSDVIDNWHTDSVEYE